MHEQMEMSSLRKLLLCMQKFCKDKVCFQGLPPDEQVAEFQKTSNHMLADEIKKGSPDAENVETLAANYTLVMTNAMSDQCREKKRLSFVTDNYDGELAKRAIDNHFKLSMKYKAAEMVLKRNLIRRTILIFLLILIVIIGFNAVNRSFELKNTASEALEAADNLTKNITVFDSIIGLFGANQERAEKETALRASAVNLQNLSRDYLVAGAAVFIVLIVGIIAVNRAIRSSRKVLNDWEDYQILCEFIESVASKAMEERRLWQF